MRVRAYVILLAAFSFAFGVFFAASKSEWAIVFAGIYALSGIAALLLARGVLGLFVDFSKPVALLRVIAYLTDPFIHLTGPLTPGFLIDEMRPFYAAFIMFAVRVLLFGFGALPPIWLIIMIAVESG